MANSVAARPAGHTGIEIHGQTIRVNFMYKSNNYIEADYFPNSPPTAPPKNEQVPGTPNGAT